MIREALKMLCELTEVEYRLLVSKAGAEHERTIAARDKWLLALDALDKCDANENPLPKPRQPRRIWN